MAEPGTEAGPTAPPPPPQKSNMVVGDATTPPPLQTDTADPGTPGSTPIPPPQSQTAAATEASGAASPPTQRPTGTGEVAGTSQLTRTPSQEKTVAAGAENHHPAPPPQEQGDTAKDGDESKDSAMEKPRQLQEGPSSPEKMPNPPWEEWGEERLEGILEDACTRLVEAEFGKRLDPMKQKGLLTFSVFPLGSQVKKQAVTYWWSTWFFQLPSEKRVGKADQIFSDLCDDGFLEPIKNRCGGVIQGCRVNPLVHWMVKRVARDYALADLDDRGNPAEIQLKSKILCLTPGNRDQLQKLRDDDDSQAWIKPSPTKVPPDRTVEAGAPSQDQQNNTRLEAEMLEQLIYKRKKVILNISAHVYRLTKPFLIKFADQLEVLQLGWWGNSDDKTYMEVEALESLSVIGKLKNLRYLSLRGLSRLTELPMEVGRLRQLAILDARGCQNLVSVPSATVQKLKGLTHLDLTDCYMLEHIGRGVSALSELRVFKGFVFSVRKRRRDACRLQHLVKLKKLQKLNINVTTDANVDKDEMAQLGKLAGLLSLTVKWGEWPSVLLHDSQNDQLHELLRKWTGLVLPPKLEKLDVRCYPARELPVARWLNGHRNLKKLYVRGGKVEKLDIPIDNKIETLRLRYLNQFRMKWTTELLPKLNMKFIVCVEVVDEDLKVMRNESKGKGDMVKDEQKKTKKKVKEEQELIPIKKRMEIPESTIYENVVWVKDPKEEDAAGQDAPKEEAGKAEKGDDGKWQTEVKGKQSSLKGTEGENEQPAEEVRGDTSTSEIKEVDGGDKYHEIVKEEKEEKDHMKKAKDEDHDIIKKDAKKQWSTIDENKMQKRDEKEQKGDVGKRASPTFAVHQTVAPASGRDIMKGAGIDKTNTDKIEVKQERQDRTGGSKGQDEAPTKEEKGDVGELKKFDGGDADEPQAEGEGEGKDRQEGDSKVVDMVNEQPTAEEDGDDGDTSAADMTSSLAPQPPEPKEENPAKLIPPVETTTRTMTPPALPPATTSAAPAAAGQAAAEPREHGKAGHGHGSTGTGGTE